MKLLQFLVIPLFFSSCISQKLAIHIDKWEPYCGGVLPTEEMSKGTTTPFSEQKFKLCFKGETSSELIITLDENGNWKGKIPKNTSCEIYRMDKTINIEDLRKKYDKELGTFYEKIGDKELLLWQSKADYSIITIENRLISFNIQAKCFVGLNPCIRYIGPLPN